MTPSAPPVRTTPQVGTPSLSPRPRMTTVMTTFVTVTAIAAATVGGAFFTFSAFVMPALGRLDPPAAVSAMQSINITAVRPPLMLLLFGTALLCLVTAWRGVVMWGTTAGVLLLVGSALYLVGVIGVTVVGNVPLNDSLASLDPTSTAAAAQWATYLTQWTAWNHVRTVAGVASAAAFLVARTR